MKLLFVVLELLFFGGGAAFTWLGITGLRAMLRTRAAETTCGALAGAERSRSVRLTGIAEPGPGGPLTSPVTGTPCVWWEMVTWRAHGKERPGGAGTSSFSDGAFTVRDPTGAVLVNPARARIWGVEESSHQEDVEDGTDRNLHRRELLLRPGSRVVVAGTAAKGEDGAVRIPGAEVGLFGTAGHSDLSAVIVCLVTGPACIALGVVTILTF